MSSPARTPDWPKLLSTARTPAARARIRKAMVEDKRRRFQAIEADRLRTQIISCRECDLNRTRKKAVPWVGPTHGAADVVLVGEAPGRDEDRIGEPFVGRSGRILDQALHLAGTKRERVFIVNTLCCRPPNNRDPEPDELAACRPNFDGQIDMAGCLVGVALGGYALANVLGVSRGSLKVRDYLEKPTWVGGRIWVGTYHPAFVARTMTNDESEEDRFFDILVRSIRLALDIRFGRVLLPQPKKWVEVKRLAGRVGEEADRIGRQVDEHGWAMVHSETLADQIVVVDERKKGKIPPALGELVTYTMDEMVKLGEVGMQRGGWGREELRGLHLVKKMMGGVVI